MHADREEKRRNFDEREFMFCPIFRRIEG